MKIAITCRRGRIPVTYIKWVKQAGLEPVLISRMRDIPKLEKANGILFSGGGDLWPVFFSSETIGHDFDLYRDILEHQVFKQRKNRAVLGICRGMQLINAFLGGTITDLSEAQKHRGEARHLIRTVPGSRIHRILGAQAIVNSSHHQAVNRPAPSLALTAYCDNVPEAAEGNGIFLVQFHPERMNDRRILRFWKKFLKNTLQKNGYFD